MRSFRPLRHLPSLLAVLALVALSCAALAIADEIKGDANRVTTGIETIVTTSPGGSGSGEFALVVSDNATDPENGCNAGPGTGPGSKPPVVLSVTSNKPWLTPTQSTISLTGCDSGNLSDLSPAARVDYSVASAAPGGDVATVTASYQSGGVAGGSYTSGSFQVQTPVPTDTTPPVVTPSIVGTLGDNGWYTSNVNVSFAVTDPESTVTSQSAGCAGATVSSDTAGVTFTCTATSTGGSTTRSVTIKRDATAPTISLRPAGDSCDVPGENGWCRGEQTAGFEASDPTSGLLAGPSPYNFAKSTTTNGAAVNISSGTLKDNAGNTAAAIDAGPYKIDSVEPSISLRPAGDSCSVPGDNGWCRGEQTAGFLAGDQTSGFAGGALTHNFTQSTTTNGAAVDISSGPVKDNAGNEAAAIDAGPYKIDSVAPAIGLRPAADSCSVPGNNGWCRGEQTAGFEASDETSGFAGGALTHPFTQSTATNGAAVLISSGTLADEAGNEAPPIDAGPYKIDSVEPSISLRPAGDSCSVPGDDGWCRGEQTAGFLSSDQTSGFAGGALTHTFTKSTTTNGAAVLISSGAVEDDAGNEAAAIDAGPYKIDSVNPTIAGSASPAPNSDGWNNGDVQVTFSCADTAGSGVVSCGPDQTLEDEGRAQSVTGSVADEAGNGSSDTVSGIDIDKAGPTAPTAQFDKPKAYTDGDGVDWYRDSVAVSFGGSADPDLDDDHVGVADKTGSGVEGYSGDDSLGSSGTLSYSGKATDRADNDSAATTGTVKVDADDPSLETSGCPTGPVLLGSARSLSASASDGESGLAADPTGTLSLDTGSVGSKSVTVTAEDNVGHEVSVTCAYSVIFDFTGFLAPIDNPVTGKMNGVKAGSSVPVKFKLGGFQGLGVLAAGYPKSAEFPCGSAPVDVVPEGELVSIFSASANGLSYDMLSQEYSYVWKTDKAWVGKCRQLVVKFIDGQSRFVNFKAMK